MEAREELQGMPIKWFRPALISSVFVLLSISAALSAQTAPLSPQEAHLRAEALLKQMTVEEKIGQMNQVSGVQMPGMGSEKPDDAIAKGQVGSVLWLINVKELNRLQHLAVEKSRLHIPLLIGFDVIHGYRTVFPVPLAMASSWDPAVEQSAQHLAAQDARAAGIQWTFTPMVDIARDGLWKAPAKTPTWARPWRQRKCAAFKVNPLARTAFWPASSTLPVTARPRAGVTTIPPIFPRSCSVTSTWFPFTRRKKPVRAAS
jgi:hypothetical protein